MLLQIRVVVVTLVVATMVAAAATSAATMAVVVATFVAVAMYAAPILAAKVDYLLAKDGAIRAKPVVDVVVVFAAVSQDV